jgi:hypothetical protein
MSEGDRYRHYKGGMYRMLRYGKLEATLEPVVIYEAEKDGSVWVRTCDDFFSTVHTEVDGKAKRVPRFRLAPENAVTATPAGKGETG